MQCAVGKLSLVLLVAFSCPLFSDSRASEIWLLYERGNGAMSQGEFGTALSLYKQAIAKAGIFPEAEVAVGDVYAEEGESELALSQYAKAYNQRKSFMVPDMQYDVLYRAASLYQSLERFRQMEDKLVLIVADDKRFAETANMRLRSQIEKNFYEKGLDRVLTLYSFDQSFAAAAHATLGWFYYRTGRYEPAVSHLLFAVIYRYSQVIRYLHDRDVDFRFSTLEELRGAMEQSGDLAAFARETGLYKDLYYLAGAAYATNDVEGARQLWSVLAASSGADTYQELARRQLKKPFLEPLLAAGASPSR